jgi:hypothetical protein
MACGTTLKYGPEKNVKYGQDITATTQNRFVVCCMPIIEMEG